MVMLLIMSIFFLGFVESSSEELRQSCSDHNTDLLLTNMRSEFEVLRQMIDSLSRKQDCPAGFNTYRGYADSCYMLITSKHDWNGAGDYCRRLARGAHLVAIETAEEDQAIINHLNSLLKDGKLNGVCSHAVGTNDFHVLTSGQRMSPTDCRTPFYWKPFQSNNRQIRYENFQLGEPNCYPSATSTIQSNCLQYWFRRSSAHTSFKWDDVGCNSPQCFLCEFER